MFATFVWVDGAVEANVRAVIPGDDGARVFGREDGAQRRGRGVIAGPAVVEGLGLICLVAAGRIRTRASSLCGFHDLTMERVSEQSKNILGVRRRPPPWGVGVGRCNAR